ncbi:hypothetical protein NC652_018766 [Populus alba x Populus x berolinensis]|uniref:Uncharacterized protein n=2 Tax=Populus alba TaxID=43335 RepID=A0ACC4BZ38_POPAL|nr:hypothetical protein NC652_018766 [Populus alba x Populus x berolinensis]
MHPPIPVLLHETSEDAEVAGYFIQKQTRVMINTYAIGRDNNSWEDPDAFKPLRFLNQGSGRRSFPGNER